MVKLIEILTRRAFPDKSTRINKKTFEIKVIPQLTVMDIDPTGTSSENFSLIEPLQTLTNLRSERHNKRQSMSQNPAQGNTHNLNQLECNVMINTAETLHTDLFYDKKNSERDLTTHIFRRELLTMMP